MDMHTGITSYFGEPGTLRAKLKVGMPGQNVSQGMGLVSFSYTCSYRINVLR